MGALSKHRSGHMTVAEFLEWDSGDTSGRLWQLRDGVPEAMAPTSVPHGAIQGELAALIRNHLLQTRSPSRMIVTPGVVPRLRAADNARIPDIAVSCTPPDAGQRLLDQPALLVEVLSRSNKRETWSNVWSYATIPSVAEILIVSSMAMTAELLRRLPDGAWPEQPQRIDATDLLDLRSIGLVLPLATLYRTSGIG